MNQAIIKYCPEMNVYTVDTHPSSGKMEKIVLPSDLEAGKPLASLASVFEEAKNSPVLAVIVNLESNPAMAP